MTNLFTSEWETITRENVTGDGKISRLYTDDFSFAGFSTLRHKKVLDPLQANNKVTIVFNTGLSVQKQSLIVARMAKLAMGGWIYVIDAHRCANLDCKLREGDEYIRTPYASRPYYVGGLHPSQRYGGTVANQIREIVLLPEDARVIFRVGKYWRDFGTVEHVEYKRILSNVFANWKVTTATLRPQVSIDKETLDTLGYSLSTPIIFATR